MIILILFVFKKSSNSLKHPSIPKVLSAITIHNKETQDVFPSIGIFDEKETLKVNEKPSGLILVGYIDYSGKLTDFKCVNKVLIKYVTENKKMHKVYYVTKK